MRHLKSIIVRLLIKLARLRGIVFLTKEETVTYLRLYEQAVHPTNKLSLPLVVDSIDSYKQIFAGKSVQTQPSYTWVYRPNTPKNTLLRCGNILTDGLVLCPDFSNQYLLKDSFKPVKRKTYVTETLVSPFGHYQDGVSFVGYYDFMFLIAAKLCRIEHDVSKDVFANSVVSYPLFNTAYERELLAYLGFSPDRILDSQTYDVKFETCLLGNSGNWFYPNEADIRILRQRLFPLIQKSSEKRKRIYISRVGRRRIENEDALVKLLEQYNFTIIEDKPRTLAEQLSIYNGASFIMGPHGASFSNIIWCEPGTHLFELFSPNYAPDHFLYLAKLMGLTYSAYCQGPLDYDPSYIKYNAFAENVSVSIPDIDKSLQAFFSREWAGPSLVL
jgi:hypothetical protein